MNMLTKQRWILPAGFDSKVGATEVSSSNPMPGFVCLIGSYSIFYRIFEVDIVKEKYLPTMFSEVK